MKKIFTSSPLSLDFGLLLLRVLLAAGLLTHGIAKIANFSALSTSFLDPLGIGVLPALLGAIFAEVVCSILVLIGLWTRLTVLPLIFTFTLIFTFIVVFFVVSGGAAFAQRELAYLYLAGWVVLFFTGAGRFSVDALRCPLKKAAA